MEYEDTRVAAMKVYEYRVTAVNAGGESDPSAASKPIKAKKLKQAPKLNLAALGTREIRVRAGEPLKIDVPIEGAPTPTVTWKKNGKDLTESNRVRKPSNSTLGLVYFPGFYPLKLCCCRLF